LFNYTYLMMQDGLPGYEIKRVTKDVLKDLIPLYKVTFGKRYSIKYLQQKFNTAGFGSEYIGYIAYAGNKAVAFYTVFPCIMEYRGHLLLSAQSGDTMTHPDHRGKGLFLCLAQKTYELARIEGIKLVFGFPNSNSYNGFVKKLLWKHEENLVLYKIGINSLPLASVGAKHDTFRLIYNFYLKCILLFYKKVNTSISFNQNEEAIHIKYDTNYFTYKCYGNNFMLNISGVNIWLKIDGSLFIGDIEQKQGEDIESIIRQLKRFAFLIGCRQIIFSFTKETYWATHLSKHLTQKEGFPVAYYDMDSGLPLNKLEFSFSALDTF